MDRGTVVKLKSGGPKMTIISKLNTGWWKCAWFDGPTLLTGEFSIEALEAVT